MAARHATIADLPKVFIDVPPAASQEALDLTEPLVGIGHWGVRTSDAHLLLASHWLTLNPATAGAGNPVALAYDRRIDKLEVDGVDASEFLSPWGLARTKWGELYLMMSRAFGSPAMMVV